jgi:fusaric acid resistance family protein
VGSLPTPREVIVRSTRVERSVLDLGAGIRVGLASGVPLFAGLALGRPLVAIWIAFGALFTAQADAQGDLPGRTRAMLAATGTATVATWVGSTIAGDAPVVLAVVPVVGFLAALTLAAGPRPGDVGVVAIFALIVATQAHADRQDALLDAAGIATGGLLLTALAWVAARREAARMGPGWRDMAHARPAILAHAVRLALGLAIAILVADFAELELGTWVAVTLLVVLRPTTNDTADRTFQRFVGTVLGVGMVTGIIAITGDSDWVLAALATIAGAVSFTFVRAQYGIRSAGWAAAVLLLVSLTGLPETELAGARIVDTLVGVVIAGAMMLAIREPREARTSDSVRGR